MRSLLSVLKDPAFRALFITLFFLGAFNASVFPYQSLIAIKVIGLTPGDFALLLMAASVINVTGAVLLGILADQHANRRRTALFSAFCGLTATGLMLALPGPVALVLAHGMLIPLAVPLYGQIFAVARLAAEGRPEPAESTQSTIRSALSMAFLLTLIFWSFAFRENVSPLYVYVTAALAATGFAAAIWGLWPKDGQTSWEDRPSGLNLFTALREISRPFLALRLVALGALNASGGVYMAVISLIFAGSALRGPSDVALYVGMVAGWEIPFMLLLPRLLGRLPRATLIALGAVTYALHLGLMPFLADTGWIWALPFLAGLGGTAMITLPIAYYQDLMQGRPGTAASLMAVQKLVSDGFVAGLFALGMAFSGLTAVALMGVALSLTAALVLYLADRFRWLMP